MIAHQVFGALPAGSRSGHDRRNVGLPVHHKSVGSVDFGLLNHGVPVGELSEPSEIDCGDQFPETLNRTVIEQRKQHRQAPNLERGRGRGCRQVNAHGDAFCVRWPQWSATLWMSIVMEGMFRLEVLSGLRRKTRRRVGTTMPSNGLCREL